MFEEVASYGWQTIQKHSKQLMPKGFQTWMVMSMAMVIFMAMAMYMACIWQWLWQW